MLGGTPDELRAILFALPDGATRRPSGRANQRQVDALQEHPKLAGSRLHLRRASGNRPRDSEGATVQATVPNPVSTVGVPEQLQVSAPPVVKDDEQRLAGLVPKLLTHDAREPVEGQP